MGFGLLRIFRDAATGVLARAGRLEENTNGEKLLLRRSGLARIAYKLAGLGGAVAGRRSMAGQKDREHILWRDVENSRAMMNNLFKDASQIVTRLPKIMTSGTTDIRGGA